MAGDTTSFPKSSRLMVLRRSLFTLHKQKLLFTFARCGVQLVSYSCGFGFWVGGQTRCVGGMNGGFFDRLTACQRTENRSSKTDDHQWSPCSCWSSYISCQRMKRSRLSQVAPCQSEQLLCFRLRLSVS